MDANFVSTLEGLVPPEANCRTVEIRRRDNAPADARLFFKDRAWLASDAGRGVIDALAADVRVEDVRAKGTTLSVRMTDGYVAELGERLEHGEAAGLAAADMLSGRRFMVGFAGPNTSKALHIGHLRNVSIGNALAGALRAGGAGVVRQSLVGDIGRNICEAMAGYRLFHDGEDPAVLGVKHDHFIGRCYARFIREHATTSSAAGGAVDPVERELSNTGDAADRLMQGWLAGEPESRILWDHIRDWVMEGHRITLQRFGVAIDRHDFESEAMADVSALLEKGIAAGVLEREPDGTVVYRSGREEFETMILARDDGFPTEHARLLGVYFRLLEERTAADTYIDLAGTEWQPASAIHMELMRRIVPERPNVGHVQLFHSMVTLRNAKMSSSDGDAVLIDELLDQLVALQEVRDVATTAGGAVDPGEVAAIVVKSFFLCRPYMKVMEFSWDLLTQADNPGWTIARAWCHAVAPIAVDDPAVVDEQHEPVDPDLYRLLVIRSQEYRRNLADAVNEYDLAGLASFCLHYCEDYLRMPTHPRMRRLARNVLGRCLRALGLIEHDA